MGHTVNDLSVENSVTLSGGAVGTPITLLPDVANATGSANSLPRSDHNHNVPTAAATSISTSSSNTQGTANSFARSDHQHDVTVNSSEATATAAATTTSTTDVLLTGMTLTPGAGTYLVMFSTTLLNSNNGAQRTAISLYANSVRIAASERYVGTGGGAYVGASTQAIITVSDGQAIEVRWRAAGGTSTSQKRTLTLVKLA